MRGDLRGWGVEGGGQELRGRELRGRELRANEGEESGEGREEGVREGMLTLTFILPCLPLPLYYLAYPYLYITLYNV